MGDVTPWVIAAVPLVLIALVWFCAALAQLFEKAGEAGWQAWVPVRGAAVFLRLGGFRAWWLLLALVPVLGWIALAVLAAVSAHRIGRVLGYGPGMTVLAVLVPPVWLSIAGWGAARYAGSEHPAVRRLRAGVASRRRSAEPDGPWPFGDTPSGVRVGAPRPGAVAPSSGPGAAPRPVPSASHAMPVAAPPAPVAAPPVPVAAPPAPVAAAPAPSVRALSLVAPGFAPRPPEREPLRPASSFAGRAAPPDDTPRETTAGDVLPRDVVRPAMRSGSRDPEVPAAIWARLEGRSPSDRAPAKAAPADAAPLPPRPPIPAARSAAPASNLVALPPRPPLPAPAGEPLTVEAMLHADTTERGVRFRLVLDGGETIDLNRSVVIVGRNPASDPEYPEAQLVRLQDGTRTLSKTHARIERREDGWIVVDLGSTNGVFVVDIDGSEYDTTPGAPARVPERLVLGTVELRVAGAA
ncbi:DUF5684 domain-containing protein [Microbacterium sp. NPDC003461]